MMMIKINSKKVIFKNNYEKDLVRYELFDLKSAKKFIEQQ